MDKTNKATACWKRMVSEHAKRRRKRNNLASDANEEKQSSNDNMQEGESYLPTDRSANNSPELSSTELQSQSSVQGKLSQFSTFAGYEITEIYTGERIKKGARVIKQQNKSSTSTASTNRIPLGSIHSVSNNGTQINVQWDNSVGPESFSVVNDQFDLLLFDNAQTGVTHTHSTCNACNKHPLSGIRWKCLNCDDIDLCTFCYMCDAHEVSHSFNRIESEDSKGEKVQPREDIQWTGNKYVCGILEDAEVSKRNNKKMKGHVLQIYDYARGREDLCDLSSKNNVEEQNHDKDNPTSVTKDYIVVQWHTDYTKSLHNVLELKCEIPASHQCYPGHLPRLKNDFGGYLVQDPNKEDRPIQTCFVSYI